MKSRFALPAALLLLPASLFAQGPLPPPAGPPAPSMKTLSQIEPRLPLIAGTPGVTVNALGPITISSSGSYYLTGDVQVLQNSAHAISITSSNVTVDLNGFTLSANGSGGVGVNISTGVARTFIYNGNIKSNYAYSGASLTGFGFASGINFEGASIGAARVKDVNIEGTGSGFGIRLGESSVVESCVVNTAANGISAGVISNCAALNIQSIPLTGISITDSVGKKSSGVITNPLAVTSTEPRVAIGTRNATYTIDQPGSYVLTGNITVATGHGILIQADDVTIDLNGFTIASTSATANGDAIRFEGARTRISIFNGHIRSGVTNIGGTFSAGPGFESGVNWPGTSPTSIRVSDLSIVGVKIFGIDLGDDNSCIVHACSVRIAGSIGIRAGIVSDCSVINGGTNTINAARIHNSIGARADEGGDGIVTTGATLASVAAAATAAQTAATTVQTAVTNVQAITGATQNTVGNVQTTANSILAAAEKRTPIPASGATVTIGAPGSYYLAGNIAVASGHGVVISSNDVTLDLNGFTISSSAPNATTTIPGTAGVLLSGTRSRIAITNGNIRGNVVFVGNNFSGSGFGIGIGYGSVSPTSVRVSGVTVSGVGFHGIDLPDGGNIVESCIVNIAANFGIRAARVRDCTVQNSGYTGITAKVVTGSIGVCGLGSAGIDADNVSDSNGTSVSGHGIQGTNITQSSGNSASGDGIHGIVGSIIADSNGLSATGNGIFGGIVKGSSGTSNGGTSAQCGIRATYVAHSSGYSLTGATNTVGQYGIFAARVISSYAEVHDFTYPANPEAAIRCIGFDSPNCVTYTNGTFPTYIQSILYKIGQGSNNDYIPY